MTDDLRRGVRRGKGDIRELDTLRRRVTPPQPGTPAGLQTRQPQAPPPRDESLEPDSHSE